MGTRKTLSSSSSSSSEPLKGGTFLHTRLRGSSQNLQESVHLYAERYFHVLTKAVGMSE